MHLLPHDINQKTGFNQLLDLLADFCKTSKGKKQCENLKPVSKKDEVLKRNEETSEMRILLQGAFFPNLEYLDLVYEKWEVMTLEGSMPSTDILAEIRNLCADTIEFTEHFEDMKSSFPRLSEERQKLTIPLELYFFLNKILDEEGNIKPDASPELNKIIKQIIAKEKDVRKTLQAKFEFARKNGWAGDTEITIRNERLVLPIIAEFKKKIKGFVHDESATGKFLYIEPIEAFEENNFLKELYIAKNKEIIRILKSAGKMLFQSKAELEGLFRFLCYFDFVYAKAKLADLLEAKNPEQKMMSGVKLLNAAHPLLKLHLKETDNETVLNDIVLNLQNRMLLISGPNAGGKSVLLKTMILLQMMYQSGLHITAASTSEMHVFKKIFVEISDSQSIENDLSTYSGHLLNMKGILEHADSETLLAIDELGSGTDPLLAAPLAESMLEELVNSGAWGLLTTHLGELKRVPERLNGIDNAGMQYHPKEYRPLYKLIPGVPGSSYAMELAKTMGIPDKILKNAADKLKNQYGANLEELTLRLENATFELQQSKLKIESKEKHLQTLQEEYAQLKQTLQNEKKEIIKKAREEALSIYHQAEIELKKVQKLLKQLPNDVLSNTKEIQKDLKVKSQIQSKELAKTNKSELSKYDDVIFKNRTPQKGDFALLEPGHEKVEVLEVKSKQSLIALGELHSWVKTERLKLLKEKGDKKDNKKQSGISKNILTIHADFKTTLDIRGERGDVAMAKLEKWIEDANVTGIRNLTLIHGKGDGILRRLSYELLKKISFVKHFNLQSEQTGGEGVTEIELH
jgi:DNA mismatch repair protein MutS2